MVPTGQPSWSVGLSGQSAAVTADNIDGPGLTRREVAVLTVMGDGCSTQAMARQLNISPRTVSKHQQNIYRKLGVNDRLTAVLLAQRLGVLSLGSQ